MSNVNKVLTVLVLLMSFAALAGITYDAAIHSINMTEFPEEDQPATLAMVYQADRSNGWNKITYDQVANTYRLDANLVIGTEKTEGTYFQIGAAGPLPETLVIKGSIWIKPPAESMKRPDGAFSIMNRLCIGDPEDDAVRGALQFDVSDNQRYGLCIGDGNAPRGTLYVINSVISVLNPGTEAYWTSAFIAAGARGSGWWASELKIVNSTLSHFQGDMIPVNTGAMQKWGPRETANQPEYLLPLSCYRVENSVFDDCGNVFVGKHGDYLDFYKGSYAQGCTFKNCQVVFEKTVKAVQCTFVNNAYNWKGNGSRFGRGMAFYDCEIQPQNNPYFLSKNQTPSSYNNPSMPWVFPEYPAVKYYRSLIVKVVDATGRPVPAATVTVINNEHPESVLRGAALTGADGLTGRDVETDAIQVIEKLFTATDDPAQPKIQTFTYTVKAEKGATIRTLTLDTQNPIPRPLVTKLE